jgi:hypothetical protein
MNGMTNLYDFYLVVGVKSSMYDLSGTPSISFQIVGHFEKSKYIVWQNRLN